MQMFSKRNEKKKKKKKKKKKIHRARSVSLQFAEIFNRLSVEFVRRKPIWTRYIFWFAIFFVKCFTIRRELLNRESCASGISNERILLPRHSFVSSKTPGVRIQKQTKQKKKKKKKKREHCRSVSQSVIYHLLFAVRSLYIERE